jgi:predicted alpha/beta superfamily hydrolase
MTIMKYNALFFLLLFSLLSEAENIKIIVNKVPSNHMFEDTVYVAGNFNGWNPEDENYRLTLNEDHSYSIIIEGTGLAEFKFTRGGWAKVEKGSNCAEISNRSFTFGSDTLYTAIIINWADKCSTGSGSRTATANVSVMDASFYIPQFDRTRRIWVYLPPDYETSGAYYPVLYMHDGQNLFDAYYSFAGEWQIDESLNRMISEGVPASIVIGIDNGGSERINEYTPWGNAGYGGGQGDRYVEFLVETLKPFIDKTFRTLPDRENTGIMGSSLGGLISYYAGLKYQEVFSKIGIFSPSFWFSDSSYVMARNTEKRFDRQMYFLAGGKEGVGNEVIIDCQNMIDTLLSSGFSASEMKLVSKADGQHSEWFWRQEFPDCYRWFWGIKSDHSIFPNIKMEVFPNPAFESITLNFDNRGKTYQVKILDSSGKIVYDSFHSDRKVVISNLNLANGIYLVYCICDTLQISRKILISGE